jgi:hypothetical protein
MSKLFRVYVEKENGENFWHDLPTYEEAVERANEFREEGYMKITIEGIKE